MGTGPVAKSTRAPAPLHCPRLEPREHPLRRAYALEILVGLLLLALALWVLLGAGGEGPAAPPAEGG